MFVFVSCIGCDENGGAGRGVCVGAGTGHIYTHTTLSTSACQARVCWDTFLVQGTEQRTNRNNNYYSTTKKIKIIKYIVIIQ